MVHAIEAYTSKNANNNPISKMLAVQALDLLGRKVLLGKMKTLKTFSLDVLKFCKDNGLISSNPHKKEMNRFIWPLFKYTTNWQQYSVRLAMRARKFFIRRLPRLLAI